MARTVLVVGAAGGVGGAVTRLMQGKGYAVIGTVLNEAEAALVREAAPAIEELVIVDLSDADKALEILKTVLGRRPIDLAGAIVCAGISPFGPVEITPLSMLRRTLEINTLADVAVYQAAMPLLRRSKGRVILIASNAGKVAFPFLGHYVASKHALEGLADVMRQEARGFGVDVVVIEPGGIKTTMVTNQIASILKDKAALSEAQRELYGDWYDRFHKLLHFGAEYGIDPMIVARTIGIALEAPKPKTRYVVGADAVQTLRTRRRSSDAKVDEMFRRIFESAAI
jgi:NAD(P)-dependent dehydrogenase (short-subunit alcohol dehydrogenase family)